MNKPHKMHISRHITLIPILYQWRARRVSSTRWMKWGALHESEYLEHKKKGGRVIDNWQYETRVLYAEPKVPTP